MIWLASYPRSGNTLVRSMLKKGWGLETHSFYSDPLFNREDLAELTGHRPNRRIPRDMIREAREGQTTLIMKTHRLPHQDFKAGDKAIYIVRDGRAALVSQHHYARDYDNQSLSLVEVVLGMHHKMLWSQHVQAWALSEIPRLLVVRYEDLVSGNLSALAALSALVGRDPTNDPTMDFEAAKAIEPKFFRSGSDETSTAELKAVCPNVYEMLHGQVAARIGYPTGHTIQLAGVQEEIAKLYADSHPSPRSEQL
jgi:hypothetical protein